MPRHVHIHSLQVLMKDFEGTIETGVRDRIAQQIQHYRLMLRGDTAQPDWLVADPALCIDDTITVVVQINGKKRDELQVAKDTPKDELEQLALASDRAQKFMDGKPAKKVIVVPGRLVNIVV